jgi:tRNA G18 (ribose-2'-O)-methylase SpoU
MKSALPWPRGYFAIGAEAISKPVNLGNLLRSAHAFGASFVFTIGADPRALDASRHLEGRDPRAALPLAEP